MIYAIILFLGLVPPPTQALYNIPQAEAAIVQFNDLQKVEGNVCLANKGFWEMLDGATITRPSSTVHLSQTFFLCGKNIKFDGFALQEVNRVPIIAITPYAHADTFSHSIFIGY